MKKLFLLPLLMLFGFAAGAQCVASFTAVAQPQSNNLLRWNFTNTSTAGTLTGLQYAYSVINYGDGSSSYYFGAHNYAAPGTYTVKVYITKWDSTSTGQTNLCSDTSTQLITVGYSPCATSFTVMNGTNGQRTFTAATPGATGAMTYSWNFGDGSASGTGSPITHTYSSNGTYTVTLTATGGGCTYTNTQAVTITGVAPNCSSLHALFSTSVSSNVVVVTNNSTYATGLNTIYTYNYGDGSANTFASSHTYSATGTYNITLKVKWIDTSSMTVYCQDSIVHSVTISSVPAPPNNISGYVSYDSALYNGPNQFRVWLIKHDSATNNLFAVDSMTTTGSGIFISYQFSGKPAGAYYTKAAILNQTAGNLGFLPTYHDTSLYWSNAVVINHPGSGNTYANIHLRSGIVTSGPGFVSGNVSLGANKGASSGVAGIAVYIRNSASQVVAGTITDANGNFSLFNLPVGTYNVYPENMNYATTPATGILITNGTSSATGINFNQDNSQMNIKPRNTTAVATINGSIVMMTIAPNPASKAVTVSWKGADAKGAHLIITGITGSVLMDKTVSGTSSETLDVSSLRSGIYFLHGTQGLQGKAQKLVIE